MIHATERALEPLADCPASRSSSRTRPSAASRSRGGTAAARIAVRDGAPPADGRSPSRDVRRPRRGAVVASIAAWGRSAWILAIVLAACSQRARAGCAAATAGSSRGSRTASTRRSACVECHQMGTRPGSHDHAPCDRCHAKRSSRSRASCARSATRRSRRRAAGRAAEAVSVRGRLAGRAVAVLAQARTWMRAAWRARSASTSTCADCHVRDGKLARPDHATCARCHAPEAGSQRAGDDRVRDAATRTACTQRTRARLIKGDLRFDHASHRADRRGTPIECEECHAAERERDDATATTRAPRVENCVNCHDDSRSHAGRACACASARPATRSAPRRSPSSRRAATCPRPSGRSITRSRSGAITPRPPSATAPAAPRATRRCRATDATSATSATRRCGPRDHRITWRELDHGTEAAADRDRCARCHVIEFCTSCHSQRPRSHGFPGSFLDGARRHRAHQHPRVPDVPRGAGQPARRVRAVPHGAGGARCAMRALAIVALLAATATGRAPQPRSAEAAARAPAAAAAACGRAPPR